MCKEGIIDILDRVLNMEIHGSSERRQAEVGVTEENERDIVRWRQMIHYGNP